MNIPQDLKYAKSHEWVRTEGEEAVVGITDFAQQQLGDLTFVELPPVGEAVTAGTVMGSVESVKAAADLYAPVSGEVVAINEELENAPELVNEDPYGKGWMLRIAVSETPGELLDAQAYEQNMTACS